MMQHFVAKTVISGLAMRGSIIAWAEDRGSDPSCSCNIIDFFSRKQRRIVRSELNAAADGIEVGCLVAYTLAEIVIPGCTAQSLIHMDEAGSLPFCLQLITDCRSLFDSLRCEDTAIPTEQSLIMLLLQIENRDNQVNSLGRHPRPDLGRTHYGYDRQDSLACLFFVVFVAA